MSKAYAGFTKITLDQARNMVQMQNSYDQFLQEASHYINALSAEWEEYKKFVISLAEPKIVANSFGEVVKIDRFIGVPGWDFKA